MTKVTPLTTSGYDDAQKAISALNTADLKKGVTFKNWNGQNVYIQGVPSAYHVRVSIVGFADVNQNFDTLKAVKSYIKTVTK